MHQISLITSSEKKREAELNFAPVLITIHGSSITWPFDIYSKKRRELCPSHDLIIQSVGLIKIDNHTRIRYTGNKRQEQDPPPLAAPLALTGEISF